MFRSRGCSHAELRVHIVANSDQTPTKLRPNSDETPTKLRPNADQTPTKLRPNSGKLRPNSSNAELQCTLFSRVSNPSVAVVGAACSHYRIRPRYCTNLFFFPRTLVTI